MSPSLKTQIPAHSLILQDERYRNLAFLLKELNARWTPHDGQQRVGEHIFVNGARRVFIECGRKWGKTDFATDLLWRLGNMIKNGQIYYFAARQKAVRELLWASRRLEDHGPRDFIKEINKTEMRITYTSDTFVKLDGADEYAQTKGFNPDVVVLDEFADYPENFWTAMSPNFASKDCIVIIISSPPWQLESEPGEPVLFVRLADLWKKYQQKAEELGKKSKYVYVNAPTSENPHISREFLTQEKADLAEMHMEDVWQREYEAKRVLGGGRRIIGTFDREKHVKPHDWLITEKILPNLDSLNWYTIADPGSSTVFAGLHIAFNRYNKEVYFLDEHYEKDEDSTTEHIIWPKMAACEEDLFPAKLSDDKHRFTRIYDEAAKWWQVGVSNEFDIPFEPTQKASNSKEFGISILRTLFRYNKGFLSERCKWLAWEIENYRKDRNGKIPKGNDHLIDCSRYGIGAEGYFLVPEDRAKASKMHPREQQKENHSHTPESDAALLEETFFGNNPNEFNTSQEDQDDAYGYH